MSSINNYCKLGGKGSFSFNKYSAILLIALIFAKSTDAQVIPGFLIPDSVCINAPLKIVNNSVGATNYFWNFCVSDISSNVPEGTNLGNIDGDFSAPVFIDYALYNNNYYGFLINYSPGNLIRLDFGNSLLNSPTATNLGNFGGIIPPGSAAEGIQVVQNEGKWYGIIVGGYPPAGNEPRILKIDFGTILTNLTPTATNWGNIGNMLQPIDLHVFKENNNWYGFTVNAENNTITRFNFTNSFNNTPTAVNLGNIGSLSYPTGIYAINDNGFWRVFIVNGGNSTTTSGTFSLTRLDFGSSLLNIPTGTNLGNPGNILQHPRDITIMKSCNQIIGFAVNGNPYYNDIVKLDFNNNLASSPTLVSLGNLGNLSFPHSISKLFRVNNDLYSFVTNAANNTLTRLKFTGCYNASIPGSVLQNPPSITYDSPGNYNINLTVDEGLPTQSSVCKNVTVIAPAGTPLQNRSACKGDTIVLKSNNSSQHYIWNTGSNSALIQATATGLYWVEYDKYGCIVRDSFFVDFKNSPSIQVNSDTSICKGDSVQLKVSSQGNYNYSWTPSLGLYNNSIPAPFATPSVTTSYIVTAADASGCKTNDTIKVIVFPSPAIEITKDTGICIGDSIHLFANALNAIKYSWSPALEISDVNTSSPYVKPTTNTKYIVAVVNEMGCSSKDSVIINTAMHPNIKTIRDTSLCLGNSVQLTSVATNNVIDFSWIPTNGLSNPQLFSPLAKPTFTTTYILTANNEGCKSADTVTITINELPVIIKSKDMLICENNSVQLSVEGGMKYEWTPSRGLSSPHVSNPFATVDTTTKYYITVTGSNSCKAMDSIYIQVKPKPTFTISPSDSAICIGDVIKITSAGGNNYKWFTEDAFNSTINYITASPSKNTTYKVIINDTICNVFDTLFSKIKVNSLPSIHVSKSNDITCLTNQALLSASGGVTYSWFPANGLSDINIFNPVAEPVQSTTYYVQGTSNAGCKNTDSILLKVASTPTEKGHYIPTAFTPNNDGINDCFGTKNWVGVKSFKMNIYNRWGERVFFCNDSHNCWDGFYKGVPQPTGTFIYQIKAVTTCGDVDSKGTVVLIR